MKKFKALLLSLILLFTFVSVPVVFGDTTGTAVDIINSTKDYYMVLYNKTDVTKDDNFMIHDYMNKLKNNDTDDVLLIDTSAYTNAIDVYNKLKIIHDNKKGNLLGIQIFGSPEDVPAFDINGNILYGSAMGSKIVEDFADFKSDCFYSNFINDSNKFKDFSIYKNFNKKLDINFISQWKVVRLPLKSKEITVFIKKYYDYKNQIKNINNIPYVNFFNSILIPSLKNIADFPYFLKERMDKEFHIINSNQYRLYSTQDNSNKSQENTLGDFTIDNIKTENEKGIAEFIFNSHGGPDEMAKSTFDSNNTESKQKIINKKEINNILYKNFYTITSMQCQIAKNLEYNTLVHEMLNGKCMGAIAASGVLFDTQDVKVSIENMKNSSETYFIYNYMKYVSEGKNKDDSYYLTKKTYLQEIFAPEYYDILSLDYQVNLYNILSWHYLGLIDYDKSQQNDVTLNKSDDFNDTISIDDSINNLVYGKNVDNTNKLNTINNDNIITDDNNNVIVDDKTLNKGTVIKYKADEDDGYKLNNIYLKVKDNIYYLVLNINSTEVFNVVIIPQGCNDSSLTKQYNKAIPIGKHNIAIELGTKDDIDTIGYIKNGMRILINQSYIYINNNQFTVIK